MLQVGNKRLKVQHKQIRPSDHLHEMNQGQGGYNEVVNYMNPHGGGGYVGGRGMNLPPSGPMAMSAGWYNRPAGPAAPPDPPQDSDSGGGGINQSLVASDTAAGGAASPGDVANNLSGTDGQSCSDPLSSMEPLRQTLPDVGGAATSAAGEN
jgi:hypothetical protein